jgi:hypothetical protein
MKSIAYAAFACLSFAGCVATPVNPDAMQIIIKFKPEVTSPESREMLSELSATANAPVLYKRAMSGGAHVLIIDAKPAQAREALKALGTRNDVLYVEPNNKRQAE